MTETSRNEDILPQINPDHIEQSDGELRGVAGFYKPGKLGLMPVYEDFTAPVDRAPLAPFRYNKPKVMEAVGKRPSPEDFDLGDLRGGNIPVAIVHDVMRGPNHLYELDSGVVTAINTAKPEETPKWETRYYPKNCLSSETWAEVEERFVAK